MEQLRFAPIIRVSTEEQERQGESMLTQETQIKEYVQSLHGLIPPYCWNYCGQESATKKERILWDKLLDDSGKDLFDAIIVCDASRWSRNNLRSLEGLEILRKNKIRFFIGTSEKNLNLPADRMTLGLFTTLNQFIAEEQVRKSQENRIHRAQRGVPTAGKLPYGRIWNKKTEQWEIDPEKKSIIEQTAKRYLAGERIKDIAKSFNVDASTLFKSLTQRCGTTWECNYKDKVTNQVVTVVMTIPRLLDQEVIDAVKARMEKNITYVRGHRKHDNLLQGMIYCKRCGLKMSASTNNFKKRYYRHSLYSKGCSFHKFVPANDLENAVLANLVKTFGDYQQLEDAIKRASPDTSRRVELENEQDQFIKELKKITDQKDTIVDKISKQLISDEEAASTLKKLRERELPIKQRLDDILQELKDIPDPENIKKISQWALKMTKHITKINPSIIFKRPYKWKRNLVEKAFGGVNHNTSKYGVFIDYDDRITFEIKGLLVSTVGAIPMTDLEIAETFNVDPDSDKFSDIKKAYHMVLILPHIKLRLQTIS